MGIYENKQKNRKYGKIFTEELWSTYYPVHDDQRALVPIRGWQILRESSFYALPRFEPDFDVKFDTFYQTVNPIQIQDPKVQNES